MNQDLDLLERVVAELESRKGDLPKVARESGIPYDTVLRIKNRENDPGYSKVRSLADYLFPAQSAVASATAHVPTLEVHALHRPVADTHLFPVPLADPMLLHPDDPIAKLDRVLSEGNERAAKGSPAVSQ